MADTKDIIQSRLLAEVSSEYDKSEGSFFYDALKPVAIELESAYADQEVILDRGFAETATGEYLDKKVADQGLVRKPATKATTAVTVTGAEGAQITAGDKVASDTVTFTITESKTIDSTLQTNVLVECDTAGSAGNVPAGAIKYFPVTIAGLDTVTNADAVSNGYDGESDEELRQRYHEKVRTPSTSGNKYHYRNWAKEVVGVGDAKVFPLWAGNGTVKIIIIDSNYTGAEPGLITEVANYIDEQKPIGATVTVESATEKAINVSFTAVKDLIYTDEQRLANVQASITAYLRTIAFEDTFVSFAKIGNAILSSGGVGDYSNLLVNGGVVNVPLTEVEIALLGVVTIV